jgi:hypothetical protein
MSWNQTLPGALMPGGAHARGRSCPGALMPGALIIYPGQRPTLPEHGSEQGSVGGQELVAGVHRQGWGECPMPRSLSRPSVLETAKGR